MSNNEQVASLHLPVGARQVNISIIFDSVKCLSKRTQIERDDTQQSSGRARVRRAKVSQVWPASERVPSERKEEEEEARSEKA